MAWNAFGGNYTRGALPTLTVVRKSADTGYPPYQATFGLTMKGETGNVGSVGWEISKDGGDYAAITGGALAGLIFTVSDSGSYLVRAVAKHTADDSLTSASDSVGFTVSATPDPITNVDFQVSEKIKSWSWTLYKMEGETEIKVKEGSTQTIAYTDYAGGDYRVAIELTTTSRTVTGEKSFNIACPDRGGHRQGVRKGR